MMVSWLFCALYLWDALVHQGRYIFFQSQKESDAGFGTMLSLLSRVKFIAEHLPVPPLMQVTKAPPVIYFPESGSTIHAVSQDSDAFRTYTSSGIFADELAFQEHAEDAYSAAKPTLDGGGRYTGVSTPNGKNFFYRMCFDVVE
jgi:phage FluMu gp28-like protein